MSRKPHQYVWPVIAVVIIALLAAIAANIFIGNLKG